MADTDPDTVGDVAQLLREGRIVSVDRAAATCTVAIGDPDAEGGDVVTSDIPWAAIRAGKTIVWSPPSVDEQVLLFAPGGDIAQAVAMPAVFCEAFPAPGSGAREFVRFGDGSEIGHDPEAKACDITLAAGGTLTIVAAGGVSIQGDVSVEGAITTSGDVVAAGISLTGHKHPGVQPGGGKTEPPE